MAGNNKGKGNRRAQQRRRRKREKEGVVLPALDEPVMLIDGNESYSPVGYCHSHKGYLTAGLMQTHKCLQKECDGFSYYEEYIESYDM